MFHSPLYFLILSSLLIFLIPSAEGLSSSFLQAAEPLNLKPLKIPCVAIIGSSGAVGKEMLKVLEDRRFPSQKIMLFANRAAGTTVKSSLFGDVVVQQFTGVETLRENQCKIVLLAVSGDFAKEWAERIAEDGTVVIDNSSAFRYTDGIPLVVPEINGEMIFNTPAPMGSAKESTCKVSNTLIANPNCTTAIASLVLYPLHRQYNLKKVIVSTYQAASGAGAEGIEELDTNLEDYVISKEEEKLRLEGVFREGEEPERASKRQKTDNDIVIDKKKVFPHQLGLNVIPHIDKFQDNG